MELIGSGLNKHFKTEDFPAFKARFPWVGGDLQTLRNSLVGAPRTLEPDARLHTPIDVGAVSVAANYAKPDKSPVKNLVLVHGLGGAEDSSYMVSATRFFLNKGFHVFRMNYRGVGPSAVHSSAPYSAGLTNDLRAVIAHVSNENTEAPVVIMGFSLGGQLALRMLGEGNVPSCVKSAVTVSAPLNLASAQRKLERPRNKLYSRYVVGNMRRDLKGLMHPKVLVDPAKLKRIWDFDEHVIAPVFGFAGAVDYYEKVSCYSVLDRIQVPTLAIHAYDDPWIPVADYKKA
ncbi:YheT family hydrolase [Kordiimonas aquimaris]|uniref:YheT family hydrolase n=1 Tax=Kordiimonas aquimaris TaxID=707591 RepID=UPI0021D1C375|nr:alpha/beta fold hydrolase [Kordiimonas aquimaris]